MGYSRFPFKGLLEEMLIVKPGWSIKIVDEVRATGGDTSGIKAFINYEFRIPVLLKKSKSHYFLNFNERLSIRTRIPQGLFTLARPQRGNLKYYKKAASIFTLSGSWKRMLVEEMGIPPAKIKVIKPAVETFFQPVSNDERETIKQKVTGGIEYFFTYTQEASESSLVSLLKAFSIFKKMQKSNVRLVLAGSLSATFISKLETYLYKADVIHLDASDKAILASALASSYAMVILNEDLFAVAEAIQVCIPFISSFSEPIPELAGGNYSLYSNMDDVSALADKMRYIYKDEVLRSGIMAHFRSLSGSFNLRRAATGLCEAIEHDLTTFAFTKHKK